MEHALQEHRDPGQEQEGEQRSAHHVHGWEPDCAYERLQPPTWPGMPRDKGLTAVIGMETDVMGWMGLAGTRNFLGVTSGFVDFVKIQTFHALSLPHSYTIAAG